MERAARPLSRGAGRDRVSATRRGGVLADLGCEVADAEPDFEGVDEIFQTLRAAGYAASLGRDLDAPSRAAQGNGDLERRARACAARRAMSPARRQEKAALERRVDRFLEQHEFLLLPVSQVVPFPVEVEWVREIEGVRMPTYIDWMATCYAVSCTGLPAISVPCGFTPGGLPVGLQIVGQARARSRRARARARIRARDAVRRAAAAYRAARRVAQQLIRAVRRTP